MKTKELSPEIIARRAERDANEKPIKKYCNHCMWTDVDPYEVVRVISDECVIVRRMDTKQIEFPKQFFPGGFVGHFADNRSGQKYEYISNPGNKEIKIRYSSARGCWGPKYMRFVMSDAPHKFYDYNF